MNKYDSLVRMAVKKTVHGSVETRHSAYTHLRETLAGLTLDLPHKQRSRELAGLEAAIAEIEQGINKNPNTPDRNGTWIAAALPDLTTEVVNAGGREAQVDGEIGYDRDLLFGPRQVARSRSKTPIARKSPQTVRIEPSEFLVGPVGGRVVLVLDPKSKPVVIGFSTEQAKTLLAALTQIFEAGSSVQVEKNSSKKRSKTREEIEALRANIPD
ncbi:hypothetical protein [Bosea sp. Root670]|uniref:hypothetical protein n=1 Tax=Bosea sp. Root670 TaxID=1736583 RepID=UPI000B0161E9|nr:hypothetical protein [Bosea sp. Root670]